MIFSEFVTAAKNALPKLKILQNESMSRHTSFRIGGPADVMIFPGSVEELSVCRKMLFDFQIEPLVLGAGTNVLAPDQGLSRVVLCLKDALDGIRVQPDNRIEAYAGATLAKVAVTARNVSLTGLEFAHGIPGTVGGGVYMNAGAYGGELKQVTESVTVMEADGTLREILCDNDTFGYRTSIFEGEDTLIIKAVFRLQPGNKDAIQATMTELMEKRRKSQPLEMPSAGSTFKRPVGGYAAALIDEAGLKGFRVGGAAVSEKHAGFVVNLGGATEKDVLTLMDEIKKIVHERTGIMLSPEIRIW